MKLREVRSHLPVHKQKKYMSDSYPSFDRLFFQKGLLFGKGSHCNFSHRGIELSECCALVGAALRNLRKNYMAGR